MRFVFVSYNYSGDINSPESWADRIRIYAGALECLAKKNEVIRIDQINYEGEWTQNNIKYYFIKSGKKKEYFPRQLHRFVKSLNPDIVVVHGLHYPLQLIQLRLRLGKKIKLIVQNHAEKPFIGPKKWLQRIADTGVNAYLFASHEMGEDWVKKGNLGSVNKIHEVMEVSSPFHRIDKNISRSKTGMEGDLCFLWVGRLDNNKDPLTVIKAFLQFIKVKPFVRLYMIYHTSELLPEINELLGQEKNHSVILVGKIPHSEMLNWFNSADFIVSGSYYEGSGTAICEAMSCGCIPIVTDIFSFRAITDHGKYGLLYEPGNESDLLSALAQATEMDIEKNRENVLGQFRRNLSFEAIANKIQDVASSL
jgi:glycosyltransferase involved in cell wall biosynthesis